MQSSLNFVRMFISIKSRSGLKVGCVGLKTRSPGQILEKKPCLDSRGHSFDPVFINFVRMLTSIKASPSSNLSHIESENRSPTEIL